MAYQYLKQIISFIITDRPRQNYRKYAIKKFIDIMLLLLYKLVLNKIFQETNKINKSEQKLMKKSFRQIRRANCQNIIPLSSFSTQKPRDSSNSLHSSQFTNTKNSNKFNSFKRLKEDRIKQKNQQGRIIKQTIYKGNSQAQRLKTLDDARTIQSFYSPRSSASLNKNIIQQSIIILRANDLKKWDCQQNQPIFNEDQIKTPFFKRRKTLDESINEDFDNLKQVYCYLPLFRSIKTCLLSHLEVSTHPVSSFQKNKLISHEGVLQLYFIKQTEDQRTILLYQPYTSTLSEAIIKAKVVKFQEFISYIIQVLKVLSHLKSFNVFPQICPKTVLVSHSSIKLKIGGEQDWLQSQREMVRYCGFYFSSLLKTKNGSISNRPLTARTNQSYIQGMTIGKRLKFEDLMEQFMKQEQFTIDEAYVKLQTLNY